MSVVVEVTVPAESFTLHEALAAEPDTTVEAERVASHSPEWALPFLWASGGDFEGFQNAMQNDPTVTTVSIIEEADGDALYKVKWSQTVLDLITAMIDQHAIILEAQGHVDEWQLRLRFAEETQVSAFQDHFTERGHPFEVSELYHPTAPRQREYGLTAEQHEMLTTALQTGYFNVPRDTSIEDLADTLGISSNAVSQRIRRASTNLIQHTLTVDTDMSADSD